MAERKRKTGVARLLEIAGSRRWYIISACVLGALAALLQFAPALLIYLAIVEVAGKAADASAVNQEYLWRLALGSLGCFLGYGILYYAANMLSHIAAYSILSEIRIKLAEKLAKISLGYFTRSTSGKIKQVMGEDVEKIELFIAHHTVDFTAAITVPLLAVMAMTAVEWRLMLAALASSCLGFWLYAKKYRTDRTRRLTEEYYGQIGKMNSSAVEFVNGMPVLRIFNKTQAAFKRLEDDFAAHGAALEAWGKDFTAAYAGFVTAVGSPLAVTLPVGIFLSYYEQDLAAFIPKLFFCLLAGGSMNLPLNKLMYFVSLLRRNIEGVRHIDEILYAPELPDAQQNIEILHSGLEFRNVSFAYEEKEVIKDLSFIVQPGETVGIVGPSGGGKTTIAQLAARFWDVKDGQILLGGKDIRDIPNAVLMEKMAFVFQDVYIFRDTVANNIRMDKTGASLEAVIAAAKASQAHEFILKLSDGYDTVLGGKDAHLSGGEKQRIAIARAILRDAPIVILDEATAYTDAENEAKIQQAFARLTQEKTVLVIAHRLSTITEADHILVIEQGRIKESGTHVSLLRQGGLYSSMVAAYSRTQQWVLSRVREETVL